jgi:hypothetical protein
LTNENTSSPSIGRQAREFIATTLHQRIAPYIGVALRNGYEWVGNAKHISVKVPQLEGHQRAG